ncbi:hypothetical protein TSAR_011307 [Trichomalopsis sarcophagae]|uniref:Uncharacterized protein n=1 Tax=Trichomalopsis sarcophagae TaxID=543379 RepID=A0A232EGK2_9HYME|nr:hypothetical protein TSAR_011307 [Trichomalopsis sarcophagae]
MMIDRSKEMNQSTTSRIDLVTMAACAEYEYSANNTVMLLEERLSGSSCSITGEFAIECAERHENTATLAIPINEGAIDLNSRNQEVNTVLYLAYLNKNYMQSKQLIEYGVLLYPPDKVSEAAAKCVLTQLIRDSLAGRIINAEDICTIEKHYPKYYEAYTKSCQEWLRISRRDIQN